MTGFNQNIEKLTLENNDFRRVVYTAHYSQLVLMSIPVGGEIGEEIHGVDQFFRIEAGQGQLVIDGVAQPVSDDSAVVVPAGAKHNIINTSDSEPLKLYTIYSPAHHRDGVVHSTRAEAEADDEEFDGRTTE